MANWAYLTRSVQLRWLKQFRAVDLSASERLRAFPGPPPRKLPLDGSREPKELGDAGQMVVVMFSYKETVIGNGHRLLKAWMQ